MASALRCFREQCYIYFNNEWMGRKIG